MNNSLLKQITAVVIFAAVTVGCLFLFKKFFAPEKEDASDSESIVAEAGDTSGDTSAESVSEGTGDPLDDPVGPEHPTGAAVLEESADGGEEYLSRLTIIGDGTTYGMINADISYKDAKLHIWSMEENIPPTKVGVLNKFSDPYTSAPMNFVGVFKAHPTPYVILSFGSYSDEDEPMTKNAMLAGMQDLVSNLHRLRPSPQVIIQSIFPVSEDCEIVSPEEVIQRNEWLKELCGANGGYSQGYYLDTYSCLADENGLLKEEYAAEDGYHLNDEGYRAVLEYIRCHVPPDFFD